MKELIYLPSIMPSNPEPYHRVHVWYSCSANLFVFRIIERSSDATLCSAVTRVPRVLRFNTARVDPHRSSRYLAFPRSYPCLVYDRKSRLGHLLFSSSLVSRAGSVFSLWSAWATLETVGRRSSPLLAKRPCGRLEREFLYRRRKAFSDFFVHMIS